MYYVDASAELRKQIRELHQIALSQGRGRLFAKDLRKIYNRMHLDPFEIGEPLYKLPMLRLQIRTASILPVVGTYSVSNDNPIVMIKSVQLLKLA